MKILKKISKKINRRVFVSKGCRYFRFKYFSILIGCLVLLFISTKLVNAYTISKTQTTRPVEGLSNGLVGHWTFDGGNMINNVTDSSGNGNNGILVSFPATSTVIVPGKVGQALTFNNDYVSINDSSSLRPSSVTISC